MTPTTTRLAAPPASARPGLPLAASLALTLALSLTSLSGCGANVPQVPTVTVAPSTATLQAGYGSQQFSATVGNSSNTQVVWKINGTLVADGAHGAISQTGLYTAPGAVPADGVTISAVSVANSNSVGTAQVTITAAVTLSLAPAAVTLAGNATQQFAAALGNATNTAVTWSVNGVTGGNATVGTISTNGLYTAPATFPGLTQVTIGATSVQDPTKSAQAIVTLQQASITVAVAPPTATLAANATQQFSATVTNATTNSGVAWSVNSIAGGNTTLGTISPAGLYTAPAIYPGINQITITATSLQDATKAATATVTLTPPVTVLVTPNPIVVNLGATQTFSAAVGGTTNTAVAWSVNGTAGGSAATGTIDTSGVFTAPATLPPAPAETITATSAADPKVSGTAQLTLQTPPAAFTLSPVAVSLNLAKAGTVSQAFTIASSAGFTTPIQFAVAGLPLNVTSTLDRTTLSGSGTVNLTLAAASISLATAPLPVTVTATSTDAAGKPLVQTATVLLTVTGWAGHVHTLAGGPGGVGYQDGAGATDELEASAVVSDGGQNLYFADQRGSALRSYGIVNQTVNTLVGGPYNFTFPNGEGIAYSAATQTVYVADGIRNQIVKFQLNAYDVTVVAGSGIAGFADGTGTAAQFYYPHGLALSKDGTTLYVADTNNETLRAINLASGAVTTVAGQKGVYRSTDGVGTAASFCQPTGLDIDSAGANLYLTDNCGYDVRQIALPGFNVSTVAGSGTVGSADGAALSATFTNLNGVAVDPHAADGLVYVADGNLIRVVALNSATVYTLAGTLSPGQADGNAGQATFYAPNSLTAVGDLVGAGTTTLFVADTSNGLLRRVDFTNPAAAHENAVNLTVTTLAGQPSHRGNSDGADTGPAYTTPSLATFSQPEGIVTDGKIAYVADQINGAIREIDLTANTVTTVAGPHQGYSDGPAADAAFYQPANLVWLPSQNVIYIADTGNGAIRKLDLGTQTVSTIAGANASGFADGALLSARFNHPYGIIASPDGTKLYIGDTGNNAIRLIDLTAGQVSTIAGNGGLGSADGVGPAARFAEPAGIAFDATGNLIYIADFENHAIRQLNLTTQAVTTLVGAAHQCGSADGAATVATLCTPALIASDGRSLFWGDSDTGLLRVLNLSTGQVSSLAGSPGVMHMVDGDLAEVKGDLTGPVRYNGVFGLAVAPDGSFILFTDKTANVVRIIN